MRVFTGLVTLMLAGMSSLQAGVETDPELIFASGFEGFDCQAFDGLGDTISIPTITIAGDFSLNGGNFPQLEQDDANFSLRDRITGDVFIIGNSHDQNYSVNIIPGRYDVMYSVESGGPAVPRNEGAMLMENVPLLESGILDISVTAYMVSGDFTLNGEGFPASEYDDAELFLDGSSTGRLKLGESKDLSFSNIPVLTGEYDIRYKLESPGGTVPWNEWGLVGQVVVTGNNANMDVDVQSVEMSGTFKHNGVLMPGVDFDDGNFYLVTADGDRVWLDSNFEGLPDNTEQIYQKHVIGGTYDVYWELESLGATVPFNPRAKIVSDADISGGTFNIDMISHSLSGDFTLNGLAFPASAQQTARIILRDSENGLNNVLGLTHNGSYSQRVLAGNYDIVYQKEQGLNVPQNLDATLGQVAVDANKTHDIDVVAAQFSAPVYHNGVLFPAAQSPSARIFVFDKARKDWAYVGNTSSQTVSALLISNTYDVYYNHLAGDEIPQNVLALIHEDLVIDPPADPPAGGGFQLQVDSVLINGQMLRNDVATPASEYDDGELSFIHGADSVPLANTHDQNYSVRLINRPEPTLYFVHYSVETPGEFMPINESAYVTCVVLDPIEF